MTVLDTSVVVDHLLGTGCGDEVAAVLEREGGASAPELLVFEVLAVLRRLAARGEVPAGRADAAVADLGDLAVTLFPLLPLRGGAWAWRENMTAADALFVALADALGEPLATSDRALARAARDAGVDVVELG